MTRDGILRTKTIRVEDLFEPCCNIFVALKEGEHTLALDESTIECCVIHNAPAVSIIYKTTFAISCYEFGFHCSPKTKH